jgi:DNA polymerase III delta subunit
VGTNHQLLVNELAKLVLFKGHIDSNSINLLTSHTPQSSVFAMLDSAFNNQTAKALKLYDEQRSQGMEPQAILGMIAWQLNVLAVVKAANGLDAQQIAGESKINPFVVRKVLNIAKYISTKKLITMLDDSLEADRKIKTTNANPDDVIQTLIITFNYN